MAYRWHQGRFLSDREYYEEINQPTDFSLTARLLAFFIPLLLTGALLALKFEGPGMVIGMLAGGFIGWYFNKFLAGIFNVILWILFIGLQKLVQLLP